MDNNKNVIKPSVGRKVWYRPGSNDRMMAKSGDQPLDATIVCVHSDRCVNLVIFDANGSYHSRSSVILLQPGDSVLNNAAYAEWMPYQISVAKPAENVMVKATPVTEAELAAAAVAPRITAEHIDALMSRVKCQSYVFPGTTSTVAIALLDGFTLAVGFAACAAKENFNEEFGIRLAIEDARKSAKAKLWELEGYKLHSTLKGDA
jgi:hypothetical protein